MKPKKNPSCKTQKDKLKEDNIDTIIQYDKIDCILASTDQLYS